MNRPMTSAHRERGFERVVMQTVPGLGGRPMRYGDETRGRIGAAAEPVRCTAKDTMVGLNGSASTNKASQPASDIFLKRLVGRRASEPRRGKQLGQKIRRLAPIPTVVDA